MTDLKLRQLERAAALGDPRAGGLLLLEQLRQRALPPGRLELAAHLGHRPARALLGSDAPHPNRTFRAWCHELWRWGQVVPVRAAAAALHHVTPWVSDPRLRTVFRYGDRAIAGWVVSSPSSLEHVDRLVSLRSYLTRLDPRWDDVSGQAIVALQFAIEACLAKPNEQTPFHAVDVFIATRAGRLVTRAMRCLAEGMWRVEGSGLYHNLGTHVAELRQVVRAELLTWTLGESDPLLERAM